MLHVCHARAALNGRRVAHRLHADACKLAPSQFATHCSSGEKVGLFGVFDGHGGPNAADFVKTNLMKTILTNQKFPADLEGAVIDSYLSTDAAYLEQESGTKREDGCTAVTAVLYQHRLVVANVGDSRAVLCRGGKAIALSMDHKPNHREERERIEAAGGMVVWAGTWRVGGVLAVSRAFGDKPLKRYVTSTPHVRIESLQKDDEFLVLASDGLWDVVSNEDAIQLVRSMIDPEEAAKHLSQEAMKRGSCDNISCIVLRF
uniref:protein-serine/threonine phosphatase n=1 Tax=Chlamydomonas euryale TaxID=1486919 RepID=A0A7R9VJQ1_9CHLO|mmetsp:Transcript_35937/g.106213  ORF Transcript_35937/g.106213 Transcript_35937/m.106213 type:complete len:260 (+) Transcript_35937:1076-1855(+)